MSDSAIVDAPTALGRLRRPADVVAALFAVNIVYSDGEPVVVIRGDLDMATAPRLGDALDDIMRRGHNRVIVELSKVHFMDTAGVHVLGAAGHRLQTLGGALTLRAVAGLGRRAPELSALAGVVEADL